MDTSLLLTLVAAGSLLAGFLGALTGLGGGVIVIPLLTLGLGLDIRFAIGASLISVIATSSGAAAAYVREGYTNLRLGMVLELATTTGALAGAAIAGLLPTGVIAVLFGIVLIGSALQSLGSHHEVLDAGPGDPLAERLRLNSTYPRDGAAQPYRVVRVIPGFLMMGVAGAISGLLGIGSGALKVIAMDRIMKVPFKVSTTTSNFMIGVTAAASAGIYWGRGYITPWLGAPVMLGVLAGSMLGARVLMKARVTALRRVFAVVVILMALQMIVNGIRGRI